MKPLHPTQAEIDSALAGLFNKPAWRVQRGHGTFLTLNFGNPYLSIREPRPGVVPPKRKISIRSEWHLWIYDCEWAIHDNRCLVATNNSSPTEMDKGAFCIDGQSIISANYRETTKEFSFEFDLGGTLTTKAGFFKGEQWLLFNGNEHYVSLTWEGAFTNKE